MDWSKTNKKLCIFIPNYKRDEYLTYSINSIRNNTNWGLADYEIVVGCDGTDIPYDGSRFGNVSSFALNNGSPRNGCFIRNYFIKRCQSDMIMMFDPEIMFVPTDPPHPQYANLDILTEFTMHCSDKNISRIGLVYSTTMGEFDTFKSTAQLTDRTWIYPKDIPCGSPYHVHHGACIKTKLAQEIHYSELFHSYGFEDTDWVLRLFHSGIQDVKITNFIGVHLYHDQEINVYKKVADMQDIFSKRWLNGIPQDDGTDSWGNG